jgi:hypothetical protein
MVTKFLLGDMGVGTLKHVSKPLHNRVNIRTGSSQDRKEEAISRLQSLVM